MKNLKKIIVAASLCAAIGATAIAGTLAYFTSETEVKTNTFTVGDVEVKLTEPVWDATGKTEAEDLVPGRTVHKDPSVSVSADSVPSYVGIVVTMDEDLYNLSNWNVANNAPVVIFDDLNEGWSRSGLTVDGALDGQVKILFTYKTPITSETGAVTLFDTIRFAETIGNDTLVNVGESFDINVQAYAVQAEGFTDAEKALDTAFEEFVED